MGDAIGGTYIHLGYTTADYECADLVRSKTTNANGATWDTDTQICYAQFHATGIDDKSLWRTCMFPGQYYNPKMYY